jgi:hypothetical protein
LNLGFVFLGHSSLVPWFQSNTCLGFFRFFDIVFCYTLLYLGQSITKYNKPPVHLGTFGLATPAFVFFWGRSSLPPLIPARYLPWFLWLLLFIWFFVLEKTGLALFLGSSLVDTPDLSLPLSFFGFHSSPVD